MGSSVPLMKPCAETVEIATMPMENMIFDGLTFISSHTPSASGNTMLKTAIALGTICAMRKVTMM